MSRQDLVKEADSVESRSRQDSEGAPGELYLAGVPSESYIYTLVYMLLILSCAQSMRTEGTGKERLTRRKAVACQQ